MRGGSMRERGKFASRPATCSYSIVGRVSRVVIRGVV